MENNITFGDAVAHKANPAVKMVVTGLLANGNFIICEYYDYNAEDFIERGFSLSALEKVEVKKEKTSPLKAI